MLALKEIWDKRVTYTRGVTEQVRTLCLAGLAVVWIFRVPNVAGGGSAIPGLLVWCAFGFILGLALDLAQYVVGEARVKKLALGIERKIKADGRRVSDVKDDEKFDYPDKLAKPMDFLWKCKTYITAATWLLLLFYVGKAAMTAGLPAISE